MKTTKHQDQAAPKHLAASAGTTPAFTSAQEIALVDTPTVAPPVVLPPVATTPVVPAGADPSSTSTTPLSASPTVNPTPASTVVATPPAVADVPVPPSGFVDPSASELSGARPKSGQVTVAPLVVAELTSSTDYAEQYGPSAPAAQTVASAVDLASRWRVIRAAADAWAIYARAQDGLAWKEAMALLTQLQPLFEAATTRDPAFAAANPGLSRMFSVQKVIAKSATATKKSKAKAKAAKDTQTAITNAVNAALVAQTAATGGAVNATSAGAATPAVTTPGQARVVTVTG
jgi:hypothetical protein